MLTLAADSASSAGGVSMSPAIIVPVILVALLYFVPSFVAFKSNHTNRKAILILNIFLGWTFIGWVIALIWSVMNQKKQ